MNPSSVSSSETLAMTVRNVPFLIDRLSEDCHPLQFLRELTQNAIEAVERLKKPKSKIVWDVDWNNFTLTGNYKLSVVDTGTGMTGEEMLEYINALSSSLSEQSITKNYGIGAKIAAAPRNRAGLLYLSWKDGQGYMIHLWKNPDTGIYGLRQFERPDGTFGHWTHIEDDIKPEIIDKNGTMVVLLGNTDDENTMKAPEGAASPSRWVGRYLNTRYFKFSKGITVQAREGWEFPREDVDRNVLRSITGMELYLKNHAGASGHIALTGATAHWWILKDETALSQNSGFIASSGHVAALYQDELYEMVTGRGGTARLQSFGVIFGHNRVVLYIEPDGNGRRLTSNTARTELILDGEPLPWEDWAVEFRENMPEKIKAHIDTVAAGSTSGDFRQSIKERLKQIRDLFRLSRFRASSKGTASINEDLLQGGNPKPTASKSRKSTETSGRGGGRAGNIYAIFQTAAGTRAEELSVRAIPEVKWITAENGSRTPPDLDDRAARYLAQDNMILANADFRVFTDMIDRWGKLYGHAPGANSVVKQAVHEWFEQQLVETIMGLQALRDARHWTVEDRRNAWSEEALTAAVMPRWHVDVNVKRALGAKLGTLKDRTA